MYPVARYRLYIVITKSIKPYMYNVSPYPLVPKLLLRNRYFLQRSALPAADDIIEISVAKQSLA